MIIITFFVLYCNPFSCIKYNFFAFYRFFFVQISHLGLLSYFICRHFLHKMPYPFVGSLTSTWVTAPISFPSQGSGFRTVLHDSAGQLQQILILHMKTDSLFFISRCIIKIINYDAI